MATNDNVPAVHRRRHRLHQHDPARRPRNWCTSSCRTATSRRGEAQARVDELLERSRQGTEVIVTHVRSRGLPPARGRRHHQSGGPGQPGGRPAGPRRPDGQAATKKAAGHEGGAKKAPAKKAPAKKAAAKKAPAKKAAAKKAPAEEGRGQEGAGHRRPRAADGPAAPAGSAD